MKLTAEHAETAEKKEKWRLCDLRIFHNSLFAVSLYLGAFRRLMVATGASPWQMAAGHKSPLWAIEIPSKVVIQSP